MIRVCAIEGPQGIDTDMWGLQVSYIWQKGSIAGPAWKMPFIGPFLDSVNPKMEKYMAKWETGDLSCVSVFHKYAERNTYTAEFEKQ